MRKILLLLALQYCLVDSTAQVTALNGNWKLSSGSAEIVRMLPEGQIPQLNFEGASNTMSGFAGCNQLSSKFAVEGEQLTIGPIVMTKKACNNMQIEIYVERFLTNAGFYKLDGDKLYLYDKNNRSNYLEFRRVTGTI